MAVAAYFQQLRAEIADIEREAAHDAILAAHDYALDMSSGNETPQTLRQKDHPYARRHPFPLLPPEKINRQTGIFFSAWRAVLENWGGQIRNDSDRADFLQYGTRRMHERPIKEAVEAFLEAKYQESLERRMQGFSA